MRLDVDRVVAVGPGARTLHLGAAQEGSWGEESVWVPDVEAARSELEAKGIVFAGETFDTSVCHMAHFSDPDGNVFMLHRRYAPHES